MSSERLKQKMPTGSFDMQNHFVVLYQFCEGQACCKPVASKTPSTASADPILPNETGIHLALLAQDPKLRHRELRVHHRANHHSWRQRTS